MALVACSKCTKTVYPVEKLQELGKVWHKQCFKCHDTKCNTTLNLKTYKAFEKLPYCSQHVPKVKHTQVASTPADDSRKKLQSQIGAKTYGRGFEKGKVTSIADDVSSLTARKSQAIQSNLKYQNKSATNRSATTPLGHKTSFSAGVPIDTTLNGDGSKVAPPVPEDPVNIPPRSPSLSPEPVMEMPVEADFVPAPEPEVEEDQVEPEVEPEAMTQAREEAPPIEEVEELAAAAPEEEEAQPDEPEEAEPEEAQEPPIPEPTPSPEPEVEAPEVVPATQKPPKYVAMYDYDAGDEDEVSIKEGDIVINGEVIAEGWMVGTNTRTGQHGMLPSNYVDLFHI